MLRRLAFVLLAVVGSAACSGGRSRDRLANQHPRSEFPTTTPAVAPAGNGAAPPPVADAGASPGRTRTPLSPVTVLASVVSRAVATDRDRVYFGDVGDDGLFVVPKTGGTPARLARRAPVRGALVVHGDAVTWVGSPGDVILRIATSGGGTPTTLRDRGLFTDVVADDDVVFTEAASGGGAVVRLTGATSARLATLDAAPRGLVLGPNDAFVVAGDQLHRVPRARGAVTVLATAPQMASPALAGDRVLVVGAPDVREHVVLAVDASGGATTTLASRVRPRSPLAVHAGVVYLIDDARAQLRAVTLATGESRPLAEHDALASAVAITADDDGVYVATDEAGVLLAIPVAR